MLERPAKTMSSESAHLGMHFTFLIVGGLIYLGSRSLIRTARQIAPVVAGKMMGLFGVFMFFTQGYLCSSYPFDLQSETGLVMVAMMLIINFTMPHPGCTPVSAEVVRDTSLIEGKPKFSIFVGHRP